MGKLQTLSLHGYKGATQTPLLITQPQFDDNMIGFLFIEDRDGDNKPDLILATLKHAKAWALFVACCSG